MKIHEIFHKHDNDFLTFDRVEKKRSNRPDLHAFLLLDELIPGADDILGSASHDEVYLSIDPEKLAEVATEDQVIELIRCGIRYDQDSLCMFV